MKRTGTFGVLVGLLAAGACSLPKAPLVGLVSNTSGGRSSTSSGAGGGTGTGAGQSTTGGASGSTTGGQALCGPNAVWQGDVCALLSCTGARLLSPCLLPNDGLGVCAAGTCQAFDPLTDPNNCGGLGIVCSSGGPCVFGSCNNGVGGPGTCPSGMVSLGDDWTCVWQSCSDSLRDQGCLIDLQLGGICCGSSCIEPQTDPNNCGACARACEDGGICVATPYSNGGGWTSSLGACVSRPGCDAAADNTPCPFSNRTGACCNGSCQDLSNDPENCGSCGSGCPDGSICTHGYCFSSNYQVDCSQCPAGSSCGWNDTYCASTDCAGLNDGITCTTSGAVDPMQCCSGTCTDLSSDSSNCGVCGLQCPADTVCIAGLCLSRVNCAEAANGDPCQLDGGLGGGICCSGRCVSPFTDPENCFGCGLACPAGTACTPTCACCDAGLEPWNYAPTSCVPGSELNNCTPPGGTSGPGTCCHGVCTTGGPQNYCDLWQGSCDAGSDCAPGTFCYHGTCWDSSCPADSNGDRCLFGPLPRRLGNYLGICCAGTCVDPELDPSNCGGCGIGCESDVCDELCLPVQPDVDCAGGCPPNTLCARGLCVDSFCQTPLYSPSDFVAAAPPWSFGATFSAVFFDYPVFCAAADGNVGMCAPPFLSNGLCTDLAHDPQNCGGFGFACPGGQICNHGVCSATPPECGTGRIGAFCNPDAGLSFACCPGVGCTDTSSDSANCGQCNIVCAAGQSCVGGTCQ